MKNNHEIWMHRAIELAHEAQKQSEVPVGAVVVADEQTIGEGQNQPIALDDPTAHAEIKAIRAAAQNISNYRLTGATLYVTLEPCAMCVGAIIHARIARVVFGTADPKSGALGGAFDLMKGGEFNHHFEIISGVCSAECANLLQEFFSKLR